MLLVRGLMGLCLLICVATEIRADEPVATGLPSAPATAATVLQAERDAEERLVKSLQKQITVDWKGISLQEALNQIGKEIDGELWINQEDLKEEGVNDLANRTVNLTLGKASLWQTLHFLLEPIGLKWIPRRGILEITTQAHAKQIMVTRDYDVRRIVETLEPDLKQIQISRAHRGSVVVGEFEIVQPRFVEQPWPSQLGRRIGPEDPSVELHLKKMLIGIGVLGNSETVEIRHHQLIVRGSYSTQWTVQGTLLALESMLANPGKANSSMAYRPGYPFDEDRAIFQALGRTRRFNVNGLPLREAIRTITKDQGIRVVIDEVSLHEYAISLDALVMEPAAETSLSVMLQRILKPLLAGIAVEEGTLVVQSFGSINNRDMFGVYDMKDIPEAANPRGLMYLVERSTSNGGFAIRAGSHSAFLLSPRLFVANQPQSVHAEVDSLLTAMRRPPVPKATPTAPMIQTSFYELVDSAAMGDFMESLPGLIPDWDANQGSIHRLGPFLAIKQSPAVHAQVREIVSTFNSHQLARKRPKPNPQATPPATAPAQ